MYKHHLTSQWRAHGIVNPMNGGRQPEDIASDFFDSLLKVSFLDLVEDEDTGRLICKMHDLVHDLSRQILQDELVLTPKKNTAYHDQRCRYLSLASCTEKIDRKLFNKVRALYVNGGSFPTDKPIKKGGCVRSVILEGLKDASFPMSALKFEYLGYLTISYADFTELPSAISGCWNLQALHIIHCYRFAVLPESIGKLKRLRTLELSCTDGLESLPQSIGDCHNLESLHVSCCGAFKQIPDSITKNEKLRILDIVKCDSMCILPSESFKMLQSINLTGCRSLEELPSSLGSDELHTLRLHSLSKLTILPQCITFLSSLKHLDLRYCWELAELPEGIVNLQKLEVLNLKGCYKLSGLPARFGQLTRLRKLGLFVIGDNSEHARISELGNLDMLSGVLKIKGMRYIKDPSDAEKAYLKKKKNIHKLRLKWPSIETDAEEEVNMEQELAVLNSLEPPSGIKELGIGNYQGLQLPCWMTKERHSSNLDRKLKQTFDLPYFPHLIKMELYCFPRLKHLSRLVGFPSLETLMLSGFDALESISVGPFPSLTELRISGMPHLLKLSTTTRIALADEDGVIECGNQEPQYCFPRLSTLRIENCPKLNMRPWFGELRSLRSLTSLQHLHILNLPNLSCLAESMRGLTSLQHLHISNLPNLSCLPESMRGLTSLQNLHIASCSSLHQLPEWLGELRSLQNFQIWALPALTCLPESMQRLTSLHHLTIWSCDALTVLPEWIGHLSALRSLQIVGCSGLTSLPSSIQHLAALQTLEICLNRGLARRYKRGEGEDRHLISHIPNVFIPS